MSGYTPTKANGLTIRAPAHPDARRRAMSGRVTVGVIYPPAGAEGQWLWRLVVGSTGTDWTASRTEAAAEAALRGAWAKFLDDAQLVEVDPT